MAEVVICSLVRDGMGYLPAYRAQLEALDLDGKHSWKLCVLEGDSQDESHEFLEAWAAQAGGRIIVGRECVGDTVENEDRAARWARAGNACFDLIPKDGRHTHVLWLEADLCFPAELIKRLLAHDVDIVAPIIWLGGFFYDTWGFRGLDGRRWSNHPPYHADFRSLDLIEVQSVGSCVLFRREVLDAGIRFRGSYENGLLVGMCQDARTKGFKVFVDTGTAILHPVSQWEAQMLKCEQVVLVDRSGTANPLDRREARTVGLAPLFPLVDLRRVFQEACPRLYRRLNTNRLRVTALLRGPTGKSLHLRVDASPPAGLLGRFAPARRFILSRFRRRWVEWENEGRPPTGVRALYQRVFRYDLQVQREEPS